MERPEPIYTAGDERQTARAGGKRAAARRRAACCIDRAKNDCRKPTTGSGRSSACDARPPFAEPIAAGEPDRVDSDHRRGALVFLLTGSSERAPSGHLLTHIH